MLLARSAWPAGSPGVALVLWQSIALAGGLAMIGALLVYGLIPFGANPVAGIRSLADHLATGSVPAGTSLDHVLALCGALLLGGHLVLNLAVTFVHAERQQRRHLNLVRLLSEPLEGRPGTRVIDHASPVAYCLPSVTHSATVLSRGLLSLLDPPQVRAVVAHEEAITSPSGTPSCSSRSSPGTVPCPGSRSRTGPRTPSPFSSRCSRTTRPGSPSTTTPSRRRSRSSALRGSAGRLRPGSPPGRRMPRRSFPATVPSISSRPGSAGC
ncbi:hypothetical protein [Cryobacterium sp. 10C3]|uniref:hypothetical protein n=1 Tax=Cryobacterium sp. 10C3 TaxID=3048577 RepID=UPI002AB4F4B4|nr:hypothetical protein [Cryobacterium sp. 10C3]MDY7556649.1 hypothetical protein [Cryobacterium sp. 10C3]